jgi:rhomboid protease GluP
MKALSLTNIFIILSFFLTLLVSLYPELYQFWMNGIFLWEKNYLFLGIQFLTYSFIHGGILHFVSNALFLFYFWNEVENDIKDIKYLSFFFFTTLFIWIMILSFEADNTVGISWFWLAIMTYYTLELKRRGNPDYRWGLTAIFVNVALGFIPGISLIGHFFWVISGIAFFYVNKKLLK